MKTEANHRGRDVRVNAYDDGGRATQARRPCQVLQGFRSEGVEHVDRSEIDDHAVGAIPTDLLDEVTLEPDELIVIERRVDGSDQVRPPTQDGNQWGLLSDVRGHGLDQSGQGDMGAWHQLEG